MIFIIFLWYSMIFYETRNLSLSVPRLIYDLIFSFTLLSHPKNCDLPGMEPHLSLFVWMSLLRQWLVPCHHILISKVTLRGSHYNRQKPSKTHAPTRIQPIGVVKGHVMNAVSTGNTAKSESERWANFGPLGGLPGWWVRVMRFLSRFEAFLLRDIQVLLRIHGPR